MFIFIIGAIIGLIFIKSSIGKIKNPFAFRKVLSGYNLFFLKKIFIVPVILIGPLELLIGLTLLLRIDDIYNYMVYFAIFLQIIFLLMMLFNYNRTLPFGCGCFGLHAPEKITKKKIIINLTMLFACSIIVVTI
ncbi:MauE/DoxX family redox-associated membrane protein [Lysinibacillus pakistanensis]|uniref:Methylamine utilisation protein MauE domain-containing protein n=1 Tax=Lysinibacillus pakistanensis TaxID=759811 RepID=A0AAX3WSJ4_9BACI|nr:MauE/DoxX family redox-associated membrane protein [Lysinibacillus pakistanensis]MDM5230073.1 hypothetical protein [Lysinibacillus pakistanensis]QGG52880.1 hypothetical protein GDS87_19110 [Lysinibacillus pakistanensis]WHY45671.1 hypothetical protein QNH22_20705 [Lysinibacillus pakistanensis]WHY50679.1 hypothetical protein QNH24_20670 [Lysinibacillus pakistanensis]